jgi:hypothetical protein
METLSPIEPQAPDVGAIPPENDMEGRYVVELLPTGELMGKIAIAGVSETIEEPVVPEPQTAIAPVHEDVNEDHEQHLKELFAPPVPDEAKVIPGRGRNPTESSVTDSAEWLTLATRAGGPLAELTGVTEDGTSTGDIINYREIVNRLHDDPELRLNIGRYLLEKIDRMAESDTTLPPRIQKNTSTKRPAFAGYENMGRIPSREYAALLALSYLDGTFKQGDRMSRDDRGDILDGQHRTAAELVLSIPDEARMPQAA